MHDHDDDLISTEALRALLDSGAPVTVVDVRAARDRAEWAIPGSIHVDAYDALRVGTAGALDELEMPRDQPVVTVCGAGRYQPGGCRPPVGPRFRRAIPERRHEGMEPGMECRGGAAD